MLPEYKHLLLLAQQPQRDTYASGSSTATPLTICAISIDALGYVLGALLSPILIWQLAPMGLAAVVE